MTVHDVMKLDILRPIVGIGEPHPRTWHGWMSMASAECPSKDTSLPVLSWHRFAGYKNGEPIGDHDVALSYAFS